MKIPDLRIKHLLEKLDKEYREDEEFKFSDEFLDSDFIEYEIEDFLETYGVHQSYRLPNILFHLSLYSFDRFIYAMLNNKNYLDELNKASQYSFLALDYKSRLCKCYEGQTYIDMIRISLPLSLTFIYGKAENTKVLVSHLADSLNAKNCLVGRGDDEAIRSWFVLDLINNITQIEINKKRALYPNEEDYGLFGEIIKEWDTNDLDLVDSNISQLCDIHLDNTFIDLDSMDIEEGIEYKLQFEMPCFQIFPYEVLVWLKLRELKNIENPKVFSHKLMDTKIMNKVSKIVTPLDYIDDLPFHEIVISNIQKKCTDFISS